MNDGNGGANYSYTFQSAGGTINQRAITVTADPGQTKVYGTADPTLTFQVTGGSLVMGDSFSGSLSRATGENVGVYAILQGTLIGRSELLALRGRHELRHHAAADHRHGRRPPARPTTARQAVRQCPRSQPVASFRAIWPTSPRAMARGTRASTKPSIPGGHGR